LGVGDTRSVFLKFKLSQMPLRGNPTPSPSPEGEGLKEVA
jgi:hypothetical protein